MVDRMVRLILILGLAGSVSAQARNKNEPEENLVPNPGFEEPVGEGQEPKGWEIFSTKKKGILTTQLIKKSGSQAVRMSAQELAKSYQGMTLTLPVAAGEKYTFTVALINDKQSPLGGSAFGSLVIEWKNEAGKEISRVTSPSWTKSLSRIRWDTVTIKKAQVPPDAVKAIFGIHLSDGDEGGGGAVVIDDVGIVRE